MGAFSDGLNSGTNAFNSRHDRKMGERKMDLLSQGQDFDQKQKVLSNYRSQAEQAATFAAELLQKGGPQTREKALSILNTTKAQMQQIEGHHGFQPGTLTSILEMTESTPTQREIAEQQGAAEGVSKVASAREVAPVAGVDMKSALGFEEKEQKPSEKSQLADALREAGADDMTALAAANGLVDVQTDTDTGEILVVNKVTGDVKRVGARTPQNPEAAPQEPPESSSFEQAQETVMGELPDSVGLENVMFEIASKMPLIGQASLAPDTVSARQNFRMFNEDAIAGIVKNPKFPVAEQNRIKKLLPSEGIFENPERAALAYDEVRKALENVLSTDQKKLETGKLTKTQSGNLVQRMETVKSLLSRLGTIDDYNLAKIPEGAVQYLSNNPNTRDKFDQKYGQGMAARILGE